jgi:hypothetical protein
MVDFSVIEELCINLALTVEEATIIFLDNMEIIIEIVWLEYHILV